MDVDGDENETQQALQATDYGIQLDYASLTEEEEGVSPGSRRCVVLVADWMPVGPEQRYGG